MYPTLLDNDTTYNNWTKTTLNEKNFGIKADLAAYVSTKSIPSSGIGHFINPCEGIADSAKNSHFEAQFLKDFSLISLKDF